MLPGRRDRKLRATGTSGAAQALGAATGGDALISVGTVYVNGQDAACAFAYRLTEKRLVWNRGADPQVAGFAFGDVSAFGSWEDHHGHLVVGIDIDGTISDLILLPASAGPKRDPAQRPALVVRFLLSALRDTGANELTLPH